MATDARKPPFAVGGAKLGDERVAIGAAGRTGEATDVEGGDMRAHDVVP